MQLHAAIDLSFYVTNTTLEGPNFGTACSYPLEAYFITSPE